MLEMNYLMKDTLSYLIETILDVDGCYNLFSFSVCCRIKSIFEIINLKLFIFNTLHNEMIF